MKRVILLSILAVAAIAVLSRPPIPQDVAYHSMADERPVLGVPNGLNVASNLPFALVGALGLMATAQRLHDREGRPAFPDPWLARPYALVFAGTLLTALGSSWYHL